MHIRTHVKFYTRQWKSTLNVDLEFNGQLHEFFIDEQRGLVCKATVALRRWRVEMNAWFLINRIHYLVSWPS